MIRFVPHVFVLSEPAAAHWNPPTQIKTEDELLKMATLCTHSLLWSAPTPVGAGIGTLVASRSDRDECDGDTPSGGETGGTGGA